LNPSNNINLVFFLLSILSFISGLYIACSVNYLWFLRACESKTFPINMIFHPERMLLNLNGLEEYIYDPNDQT